MQFEEFDKKAQEAASHHHPAYDEKAWGMMEKLLDKHLPEKKNRRRRFLFLFLLVAAIGTAGIWLLQPAADKKPLANTEPGLGQPVPAVKELPENKQQPGTVSSGPAIPDPGETEAIKISNPIPVREKISGDLPVTAASHVPAGKVAIQNKEKNEPVATPPVASRTDKDLAIQNSTGTTGAAEKPLTKNLESVTSSTSVQQKPVARANGPVSATPDIASKKTTEQRPEQNPVPPVPVAKKPQPLPQKNTLFLAFSAGPDVSFTAGGKPGTTKINGGVGIGFTYKNRVTLRTGIYDGRKIYKASPDAYHAPDVFYVYYPFLERVRANCRIKEIPVNLSYHFGRSERNSWMLSTGISSLVMKEEVYDYTYKRTANGPLVHRRWSIVDKEKHLFSVLTVGAGFQRKIGKHVSFMAEPYLKIPLTGVGYGKVKLYSSGLSFSVAVSPFTAKPKKIFSAE